MKSFTKYIQIGAGCIKANIVVSASAFVNPCNRWSIGVHDFAALDGNVNAFSLSKGAVKSLISAYVKAYTKNCLNKMFFKYIVKLNAWALAVDSVYSLRAITDDGLDCMQSLETDVVDYISLYKKGDDGLYTCIADFHDSEQAVLFFKSVVGP